MNKVLGVLTLVIWQGCAIYTAQPIQPILVKDKCDVNLQVSLGLSGPPKSSLVSVAAEVAPTRSTFIHMNTNFIASGMFHGNVLGGYSFRLGESMRIDLFAGFLAGRGRVRFGTPSNTLAYSEEWNGNFNTKYAGVQFRWIIGETQFGVSNRMGIFNGDYSHTIERKDDFGRPDYIYNKIEGKGILIEPGIFMQHQLSQNMGMKLTTNYSDIMTYKNDEVLSKGLPRWPVSTTIGISISF